MDQEERLRSALADRYRIESEIGRGGMAAVYLARDLKHDRQVAVKVLNPELAQNLGVERFLREIRTVAKLTHPHILPIHDSGEADGFLFFVMPYAKGESLRSRLTKEKQLPVEDAIQITREIADALAYAHREGVIHRDVKPANIMLEEGHAVLADFGVAYAVAEAKDDRITRTGTSLGTPAYMSPEQATGEQDLDGRSDQYALGCVLYEMLAGHPPFTGAQVEAVIRQHLTAEPPSVTQARPSVPEEVVKVISRALSKSPADRFRTTGGMAAALALPTTPVKASARRSSVLGFIVAGVAGVVIIGAGAYLMSRSDAEPPSNTAPIDDVEGGRHSVAVLPFEDSSPNPENVYFAGGMQEQIISKLSGISAFRVIPRTSVMQYAERRPDTRQIAKELGVTHLVEGSTQVAGGQVRLTVRLIDAGRNDGIWTEEYLRELTAENLISVQSDVARQVAFQVGVSLTPEETEEVARVFTDNTEAYLLFLRGREAYVGETVTMVVGPDPESVRLFQRAVDLDPDFAPALAGLALALTRPNVADDLKEVRDRVERAANRALQILPSLTEAQVALGRVSGEPEEARRRYLIAQADAPNSSLPLEALGMLELENREDEAALDAYERARALDPRNPGVLRQLTRTYAKLHRFDDALRAASVLTEVLPDVSELYFRIYLHLMRGAVDEARTGISELLATAPDYFYRLYPGQYDVVLRIMTPEQRRLSFEAYWATRNQPCDWLAGACLRRAIFEEANGSKEQALRYWDSLRVVIDSAVPPLTVWERFAVVMTYQGLGEKDSAIREARSFELDVIGSRELSHFWRMTQCLRAAVYTHFGESDAAIDLLEEVVLPPSNITVHILEIDPVWDPLRSNPRFQALLEKYRDDVDPSFGSLPPA